MDTGRRTTQIHESRSDSSHGGGRWFDPSTAHHLQASASDCDTIMTWGREANMPPKNDLTGQRFGRWTVVEQAGRNARYQSLYLCRCDCGASKTVLGSNLSRGLSLSCGCKGGLTHGHNRGHRDSSPTYESWRAMLRRCTSPARSDFRYYGGRGITVCERWRIFKNFLADMGERPPGMTLDRRENNLGYEPDNCRWASSRDQWNNRRKTVRTAVRTV